jgi:membrane-associated phospholipid phosphatase
VVVTGNHYVLDVIGGLIVLGLAVAVTTATRRVGAPALPVLRGTAGVAGGGVSRRRVSTSPIP